MHSAKLDYKISAVMSRKWHLAHPKWKLQIHVIWFWQGKTEVQNITNKHFDSIVHDAHARLFPLDQSHQFYIVCLYFLYLPSSHLYIRSFFFLKKAVILCSGFCISLATFFIKNKKITWPLFMMTFKRQKKKNQHK